MPKAFPAEFRADVVAMARKREVPRPHLAQDFHDLRVLSVPVGRPCRDRRRCPTAKERHRRNCGEVDYLGGVPGQGRLTSR